MSNPERIVLVNAPPTEGGKLRGTISPDVFSKIKIPNAGIAAVHGVLRAEGYSVNTIDPRFNPDGNFTDADLEEIATTPYLGIGSMTRNRVASRELIKWYKERNPNGKVFAGGPDLMFNPEIWLTENRVDVVMRKEAEKTLIEFFDAVKNGYSYENIEGLSFKKDGQIIYTKDRPLLTEEELSTVALPYYTVKIENNRDTHIVSGSRGCYGNCEFCSVINMYKDPEGKIKYRRKSTDRIIAEIMGSKKTKMIFLADDSFAPQEDMERAKDIMKAIIAKKLNNKYYFLQVEAKAARDKEFIKLADKMNVLLVFEGIESLNQQALSSAHKRSSVKDNLYSIGTYDKKGIGQQAMIVIAIKGDTPKTVDDTMKKIEKSSVSTFQCSVEIPIPGSKLGETKELLQFAKEDTNLVTGQYVVSIPPAEFTLTGLQEQLFEGNKKFYTWKRLARLLLSPNNLKTFFIHPKRAFAYSLLMINVYNYAQKELLPALINSEYTKKHMDTLRLIDEEIARKKAEAYKQIEKEVCQQTFPLTTGKTPEKVVFDAKKTII